MARYFPQNFNELLSLLAKGEIEPETLARFVKILYKRDKDELMKQLIHTLGHEDVKDRMVAISALALVPNRKWCLEKLYAVLDTGGVERNLRWGLIAAVQELGKRETFVKRFPHLLEEAAMVALSNLVAMYSDELLADAIWPEFLERPEEEQVELIRAFQQSDDPAIFAFLDWLSVHGSIQVQKVAAETMEVLHEKGLVPEDDDENLDFWAAEYSYRHPTAYDSITEYLDSQPDFSKDPEDNGYWWEDLEQDWKGKVILEDQKCIFVSVGQEGLQALKRRLQARLAWFIQHESDQPIEDEPIDPDEWEIKLDIMTFYEEEVEWRSESTKRKYTEALGILLAYCSWAQIEEWVDIDRDSLEELLSWWYVRKYLGSTPEKARQLLSALNKIFRWVDSVQGTELVKIYRPVHSTLKEDLPRVLQVAPLIKGSGSIRGPRGVKEGWFQIVSTGEKGWSLRLLGETEKVHPVQFPGEAASHLRVGDILNLVLTWEDNRWVPVDSGFVYPAMAEPYIN